jgi:hypothetical protein
VIEAGLLSPEVVFDASRSGIPGVRVLRGQEEMRRFFKKDCSAHFPLFMSRWVGSVTG